MCKILYQVYACGLKKPICITACPIAELPPQYPGFAPDTNSPAINSHHRLPNAVLDAILSGAQSPIQRVDSPVPSISSSPYLQRVGSPVPPISSSPNSRSTNHVLPHNDEEPIPYADITGYEAHYRYCADGHGMMHNDLPPSKEMPCMKCYMRPEYADYRSRYKKSYLKWHPDECGQPDETTELHCGFGEVAKEARLVNVITETWRTDSSRVVNRTEDENVRPEGLTDVPVETSRTDSEGVVNRTENDDASGGEDVQDWERCIE